MANHSMPNGDISDDALVHRLFELAHHESRDDTSANHELVQLDAIVYARLAAAYGESSSKDENGRIAA